MKTTLGGILALALLLSNSCVAKEPSATLDTKDDGKPTEYCIKLTFGQDIPYAKLNSRMFALRDAELKEDVALVAVRRLGAVDPDKPEDPVRGVILYAKLNPTHTNAVEIAFPDGSRKLAEAAPIKAKTNKDKPENLPPINLHHRYLTVEATPFAADGDKGIGLKYDVRYALKNFHPGGGLLRIDLQSHGELSLTSQTNSATTVQNSLKGGLDATYLYNVHATVPLGDESRTYGYPLGFRISPAEFETDNKFKIVDYSAKILVGGAIPLTDYPSLIWSKWFDINVPFFPPTIFTGLAYLDNVKNDGTDPLATLGHARWDTELLYDFPLHNRVDLRVAWHSYIGLEKSFNKSSYEVGFLVYVDEKRTHGFALSYQKGAMPPEFKETESWRLGYTAKF